MLGILKRLIRQPRPHPSIGAAQWRRIEATLPFLEALGTSERARLREMALEFIAAKEWHGAQGLELTPMPSMLMRRKVRTTVR